MREQILALVERHLGTIREEARAVDRDIRALGAGAPPDMAEAVRRAHTLKGSSGNLGFAEVSRAAERVEHGLRAMARGGPPDGLVEANGRLQALADHAAPEQSSLYRRFA